MGTRMLQPVVVPFPLSSVSQSTAPPLKLGPRHAPDFEGIVGDSAALRQALEEAAVVASIDITVLITGACGTGKSQLARAIHKRSPRKDGPFIEVNCSAIPENLFESEFFGALPGAFTGATRRLMGKIAGAEGGTLFLDEVTELSAAGQAKLLQFLESRRYCALGSSAVQTANVRLIAATNADVSQAVSERRFREDLLYRLQGLAVRMPSLAERREDVAALADLFCRSARAKHVLPPVSLSARAVRILEHADWPGNVRQLAATVEMATVRAAASGSPTVEGEHLKMERGSAAGPLHVRDSADAALDVHATFHEQTRRFQREVVIRALESTQGCVAEAARKLGLTRAHLYNLMNSFDIERQGPLRTNLRAIRAAG